MSQPTHTGLIKGTMDINKIKKLLDEIDKSCAEGWDYNIRSNFYDIMNIADEIKEELDE